MQSLKVETYADALKAVHEWFDKEPERTEREKQEKAVLTWEEWDAIQVRHFAKKKNQKGAVKTLEECRKAQRLFIKFTGADSASTVDADMAENSMHECGGTQSKLGENYTANGIRKTLSHMSASFNRCRRTAGKKCVRGVVAQGKLLMVNPYEEVQWVEADDPDPRHFNRDELRAFLNWKYLAACPWPPSSPRHRSGQGAASKKCTLFDWIDREGFVTIPDGEAKWAKGRVIRLPATLLADMGRFRTAAPYVWAGYVDQLRAYHRLLTLS